MKIEDLNGKKVCILGYGREGKAMFHAIEKYAPYAKMTIGDVDINAVNDLLDKKRSTPLKSGYSLQTGINVWLRELDQHEIIIKSPGIFSNEQLEKVKEKITSSTQIFFDSIQGSGSTTIGVTGSKGKSTTSSLIASILREAGKNVYLCGNIGIPSIGLLEKKSSNTIFVLEMSSYQLSDLHSSPTIAVVTSFFPEHLDYHGTLENYLEAKKHITMFQTKEDRVYFHGTQEGPKVIANMSAGEKIPFTDKDSPVSIEETHLIGTHNLSNIAAAFLVCRDLGIEEATIIKAIKEFKGLNHRLENLGEHHGITWINDSISTTPESTIAAIEAIGENLGCIILGGQDRGYDFSELIKKVPDVVILFPGSGETMFELLKNSGKKIILVQTMKEAVDTAKKETPKGTVCLLSPASPSYGYFKNFEERGDAFRKEI